MCDVCWGSLTLSGDRRGGWWGDKWVQRGPLWAYLYRSETTLPLLLLRRLDLLVVIPKGPVFIVICAHVEALPRKGCLSASHEHFFWLLENNPFQVIQETGMCSGAVGWAGAAVAPECSCPSEQGDGVVFQDVQKDFSLVTIIPCCTRHLILLLQEGKAERDGEQRDCSLFLSPGGCII